MKYFRISAALFMSFSAMAQTQVPHEFQSGDPALASEVNENFSALAIGVNTNTAAISANESAILDAAEAIAEIVADSENTVILDFTNPDHCTVDEPGNYLIDRSWDFNDVGSNVACSTIAFAAMPFTLDLRGHEIIGIQGIPTISECGIESPSELREIRNGHLIGQPDAIWCDDNGFIKLQNMQVQGDINAGWGNIRDSVISQGTAWLDWCDHTGPCRDSVLINNRMLDCSDGLCATLGDRDEAIVHGNYFEGGIQTRFSESRITQNVFQLRFGASTAAIHSRDSSDTIAWNMIFGYGHTGDAIRIGVDASDHFGTAIVEGNIIRGVGVGIQFLSDGHYYGNNRVSANAHYVGTESQTDWGGNVSF